MAETASAPRAAPAHSLANRVAAQLAVAIGLVFIVATAILTLDIRRQSIAESLADLDARRAALASDEEARFARIAFAERRAATLLAEQLADPASDDPALFDRLFPLRADGTRRSIPELFDGGFVAGVGPVAGIGGFIAHGREIDAGERRTLLAALRTLLRLGEGLRPELKSLYFFTPGNSLIMFAPDRPDRLMFYRETAPANLDFSTEEFSRIVATGDNPRRELRCTGLQPILYDRSHRTWTTGCMTPVDRGGRHIGSFGISLLLDDLLKDRAAPGRARVTEILIARDGRLIYHPDYTRQANSRTAGFLDLRATSVPKLRALWALVEAKGASGFVGRAEPLGGYVSIGRVATPGWYAVTYRSAADVDSAAYRAARWVLLIGLACLLLVTLLLRSMLARMVGAPLAALAGRADHVAALAQGGGPAATSALTPGSELERLHNSFDAMERRVEVDRLRLTGSFDLLAAHVDNVALVMLDRDGCIINWNVGAERIFGHPAARIVGRDFSDCLDPAHGSDRAALLAAGLAGQSRHERAMRRSDGSSFWGRMEIEPIARDGGELVGFAIVMRDVTDEHVAAAATRETLRLLNLAEATAGVGHWRLDLASNVVVWSETAYRIHGLAPGTPIDAEAVIAFYTRDSRATAEAAFAAALSGEPGFAFDGEIERADGKRRNLAVKGQVERDAAGVAIGYFGVIRDITADLAVAENERVREALPVDFDAALHRVEAGVVDLIRSRDAASAAAAARTEFLAVMCHEIRTPMSGIVALLDLLDDPADAESQARTIASIKRSAATLMRMLDNVLDDSTIETGNLVLDEIAFDLAEIVEATATLYATSATRKGLTLESRVDTPLWVRGDPSRLQQILANFTSNAIKFTAEGGISLRALRTTAGKCRVEVHDTGIGIAAETSAGLFIAYNQGEADTARRFGGTGLGLAISRRLAEAMGGTVGVDSTPGVGSCFWVELPLPATAPAADVAPVPLTPLRHADGSPIRVLLVEDSETLRLATAAQLTAMAALVATAGDGLAALEALARARFDVVVMDCAMPRLDGEAATRLLRRLPDGDVPVIGLTGFSEPERQDMLRAAGMAQVLRKPFRRSSLHAAIMAATANQRQPAAIIGPAGAELVAQLPADSQFALVAGFERDIRQLVDTVKAAIANDDPARFASACHGLKGLAATLAATDLAAAVDFAEALVAQVPLAASPWLAALITDTGKATATALQALTSSETMA